MIDIFNMVKDSQYIENINMEWNKLGEDFVNIYNKLSVKFMKRSELSFHDQVKLLGFLANILKDKKGDIVEIGVWKGKSLALMDRCSNKDCKIIGIDPCEISGQLEELNYFKSELFPRCIIINNYSHLAIENLLEITKNIKLLHIDGDHSGIAVRNDFLLYHKYVISGGFIVFDDYDDYQCSPEVRPTIDAMNDEGLFSGFIVIGVLIEFPNSFVLHKR